MGKKNGTQVADTRKQLRGKIKSDFPKHTLEEALRVPKAIEEANGGQPLPPTEVAIALGMSPGSSEFRTILSSAIKYNLTRGSFNQDRVAIEELGLKLVEPKSAEEIHSALVSAALAPETFRSIYDYFRGKKLPEPTFFQNTVVREFGVPKEHAEKCASIFNANMDHVGLVRVATTGRWLSTEFVPVAKPKAEDDDDSEGQGQVASVQPAPETTEPSITSNEPPIRNAIFVAHGKNKKPLSQLKEILDQYRIPYKVAVDEANEFRPISQKVAETMKICGAAILVFTADEEFHDKDGKVIWRPSENVVYELGASSVLYGGRIIIFKEIGVHFPTNF